MINGKGFTPILVMAYCRPKNLEQLLLAISLLPKRDVIISIDNSKNQNEIKELREQTLKIAQRWSSNSLHNVKVIDRSENLGLYDHFFQALREFFSFYEHGIILEDDISFDSLFIEYIDNNIYKLDQFDYWSIQGYNPNTSLLSPFNNRIDLVSTSFHTVWGWATSRTNIDFFLKNAFTINNTQQLLKNVSGYFTYDPMLRNAFILVWLKKYKRALKLQYPGGWDNLWQMCGWLSKKKSITFSKSLSWEKETLNSFPSHQGVRSWNLRPNIIDSSENLRFSSYGKIKKSSHRLETQKLRIWGVRRIYSWLYCFRIRKQLKFASSND